jgi:hypothetical protein
VGDQLSNIQFRALGTASQPHCDHSTCMLYIDCRPEANLFEAAYFVAVIIWKTRDRPLHQLLQQIKWNLMQTCAAKRFLVMFIAYNAVSICRSLKFPGTHASTLNSQNPPRVHLKCQVRDKCHSPITPNSLHVISPKLACAAGCWKYHCTSYLTTDTRRHTTQLLISCLQSGCMCGRAAAPTPLPRGLKPDTSHVAAA